MGSDFWFTVGPRAGSETAAAVNGRPAPSGAEPRRVLLAEDSPVSQRVATAMLEHLGFAVDVASDGAAAVEAAGLVPYELILMDCQMPLLDGYEATGEIRHLERSATRTPIVGVTASAMKTDQQRCLGAGMDDYLPKPLTLKSLAAVMERWAPATQDAGDAAVLDPVMVDNLLGLGGDELLGHLVELFRSESATRVAELHEGLDGDGEALSRSAHGLRGASANLGATGLAALCATLETDGPTGDRASNTKLVEAVEAELVRVHAALDERIAAR
jgi:CheY-like chemotaxis protein/HPt (histidine-containing phosphotransfer) domain-containing protein